MKRRSASAFGHLAILFAACLGLMASNVAAAPPQRTLTIEVQGSGSVDLDPRGGTYERNTLVKLTANPTDDWSFDHWEGGAIHGSTASTEYYLVTRDITLTAVFTTSGGGLDGVRRGDAVIRVVDGDGAPIPAVDVQIDMTDIDFAFGTAIAAGALDYPEYAGWIRDSYNWAVAENASKWPSNEPVQGAVSYANADKIWNFANANGIRMRGHCVFWAVPDFVQQWVKDLDDPGLQSAIDARIADAVGHFDGKYEHWDINNEMLHGSFFADRLGASIRPYMFNEVKAADPDVLTFINDYNIIAGGYDLDAYLQQVADLQAAGAHIDGIGVQGHFSDANNTPAQITARLDALAAFDLPIWVTEYDYANADENARADFLEDFYRTAFAHPAVEGVLMWGFWANAHWRGPDAALLDADFTVNAAGQRYRALRDEWWTNAAGTTGAAGEVVFNGFYGDYAVVLSDGMGAPETHFLSFERGGPTTFELALGTGTPADVVPPEPDPASFAVAPHGVTRDVIAMEAEVATDPSGVEYYFANLDDPAHDSGWQDSPLYYDSGLDAETTYTYQVAARDKSLGQNETDPSAGAAATTGIDDGNLVTNEGFEYGSAEGWNTSGAAIGAQSDTVRSGEFAARAANRTANWDGIGQDLTARATNGAAWTCSGWMRLEGAASAPVGMTLLVRDQAGDHYTGIHWTTATDEGWIPLSGPVTVNWTGTLELVRLYFEGPDPGIDYLLDDVACYSDTGGTEPTMHVDDLDMSLVTRGPNYAGRVTVRIVDEFGAPVVGAAIDGTWSGATSSNVGGATDGTGEVTFTSPQTKAGGTFTFTVNSVEEPGYLYAPDDNMETQDSISSPMGGRAN